MDKIPPTKTVVIDGKIYGAGATPPPIKTGGISNAPVPTLEKKEVNDEL